MFLVFILFVNINLTFTENIFAQTATSGIQNISQEKVNEYSKSNLVDQARKQCRAVIATRGVSAAFNDDGQSAIIITPPNIGGSGGGTVAVRDSGAISNLVAVNTNLGDILKVLVERNFGEDCFKALALANANKAITKELAKSQRKVRDEDLDNPNAVIEKAKNKIIEDDIERNKKSNSPYKDTISKTYSVLINEKPKAKVTLSPNQVEERATGKTIMTMDDFDEIIVEGNNPTAKSLEAINLTGNRVAIETTNIYQDSQGSGGLAAARYCVETFSGADPENIKWNDKDCKDYNKEPIIISQERVKQIVNAPYNQAFSQSATLGLDPALNNINTRINSGKLFEKGINENFGKSTDNVSGGSEDIKKIKEALIGATGTVTFAIDIQRVLSQIYSSSTSSCIYVPVIDRNASILEATTKRAELEIYKRDLTVRWTEVINNPGRDYTNLFIKLGLDLSNKYSKDWLSKTLDEAKAKLAVCTVAKTAAGQ